MKRIEVVAAIIHDAEGLIFATQQGYGEWKAVGKREQSPLDLWSLVPEGSQETCLSYAEREQLRQEGKAGWGGAGGKMGAGKTPEEALKREIWEKLETSISAERLIETVEYDCPKLANGRTCSRSEDSKQSLVSTLSTAAFHLTMHCYLCHVESGKLLLKEHADGVAQYAKQYGDIDKYHHRHISILLLLLLFYSF